MLLFDFAFWLRSSSLGHAPDLVEVRDVDPLLTVQETVLALMLEWQEPYVCRASVKTPFGLFRFASLALPVQASLDQPSTQVVVDALLPLLETDGIDLVTVSVREALDLVRALAEEPGSLFARWSLSALAADRRLFADYWNERRAALVRRRLRLDPESEVL